MQENNNFHDFNKQVSWNLTFIYTVQIITT